MNSTSRTVSRSQAGFIGTIVLVISILIAVKYFLDFDIVKYLMSEHIQGIFGYVKRFFEIVWFKYIAASFWYLWNEIVVGIIWHGIMYVFDMLKGWVDKN